MGGGRGSPAPLAGLLGSSEPPVVAAPLHGLLHKGPSPPLFPPRAPSPDYFKSRLPPPAGNAQMYQPGLKYVTETFFCRF